MVTWPCHTRSRLIVTVWIYIYLKSRDPKNLRNKKKIIALASLELELRKVTLRVTWPGHTKSGLIVTVWIHIYLTSATPKTCETKKDHRSSVTRTRVRKGHAQGHVTLSYKITLDSYKVDSYLFGIRNPKNQVGKPGFVTSWRDVMTSQHHTNEKLITILNSTTQNNLETKKHSSF